MAKPNSAKPGCFSDFFHIFFCAENGNSSPMHLPNHITKPYATELVHTNKDSMVNETKPGVVARLMGLDSLSINNLVPKENTNTIDSVPRSRSVNFVDYLLKFDTSQFNHHQVKASASFREVPALIQHKNHDLLVLYWDNKEHEVGSFLKKQEMWLGESRMRKKQGSKNKEIVAVTKERNHAKRKKISKFENEPRVVPVKHGSKVRNHNEAKVLAPVPACSKSCSNRRKSGSVLRSSPTSTNKQKKVVSEPKHMKKTRKQGSTRRIETECSSENTSLISVLDDYDCSFLYGPDFADYTSPLMSKTKWESSLFWGDNVGDRASKDKGYSYSDINKKKEHLSELMVNLCNLTENDIIESDFTPKHMCESISYKEICLEYEHNIFDILLHEVVNELVELSCGEFCYVVGLRV